MPVILVPEGHRLALAVRMLTDVLSSYKSFDGLQISYDDGKLILAEIFGKDLLKSDYEVKDMLSPDPITIKELEKIIISLDRSLEEGSRYTQPFEIISSDCEDEENEKSQNQIHKILSRLDEMERNQSQIKEELTKLKDIINNQSKMS
jgi:hypothetical protein